MQPKPPIFNDYTLWIQIFLICGDFYTPCVLSAIMYDIIVARPRRTWHYGRYCACSLIISSLLFFTSSTYGQVNTDSLEMELRRSTGEQRLNVLIDLMEALFENDSQRALAFAHEAITLLRDRPDDKAAARLFYFKAMAHDRVGDYDSVLVSAQQLRTLAERNASTEDFARASQLTGLAYWRMSDGEAALTALEEARRHWETAGNSSGMAQTLSLTGLAHYGLGQFDQAIDYLERALVLHENLQDQSYWGQNNLAWTYNNLGFVHADAGNLDEALTYHLKALPIREKLGSREGIAASLNNIGIVYLELGNLDEALAFFQRVQALAEELGNRRGVALSLNNIATTLDYLGEYDKAREYYLRSLAVKEEIGDQNGVGWTLNNLATLEQKAGGFEAALDYHKRAQNVWQRTGSRDGEATTLSNMAELYLEQEEYRQALPLLQDAQELAREAGASLLVRDTYEQLSQAYEGMGQYEEALNAYKSFKAMQDSLLDSESRSVIAEMQQQYRTREQQQRIELLQQERKMQQLWISGLGAGLILLLFIAGLVYSRYRLKTRSHRSLTLAHKQLEKTHEQLIKAQLQLIQQEKLASLGQLTAGIAHEIKNPLNFINNFSSISTELAEEIGQELDRHGLLLGEAAGDLKSLLADLKLTTGKITQHGKRADAIIQSMMAHARHERGQKKLLDLNAFVDEQLELVSKTKRLTEPEFSIEIERAYDPGVGEAEMVPEELGRVLINVLSNAFDAVRERMTKGQDLYRPRICVRTRRNGEEVEVRVEDNGPGIPDSVRDKIFEPFFTTKPAGSGTGLGLSLSYDIVTQVYGGRLDFESSPGQGTTFIIALPVPQTVPQL